MKFNAANNAFSGTIPDQIINLVYLRQLWLELNYLSGELPAYIGNMESLGMMNPVVIHFTMNPKFHISRCGRSSIVIPFRKSIGLEKLGYERAFSKISLSSKDDHSITPER